MLKRKSYSDRQMIAGCLQNDRFYQELLYRRYFPKMMNMCLRYTSDKETAMEIVNDGFLRVYKKIDKYSFKGSLEGWIRRLVFHSVSEYFKRNSKYLQFLVFDDVESDYESKALDRLYIEDILRMIEQLPPASRNVLKLYAIEGFSHVEIAKKEGISIGTSKWHLSAARTKLKEILHKHQYSYSNHAG